MKPIGILYATKEGQTKRISEYIASRFRTRGFCTDLIDLGAETDIELGRYEAVLLASPVHAGKHHPVLIRFVKRHLAELDSLPAVFLSVTLSEAGAERRNATAAEHAQFMADVQKMIDAFIEDTGWHPKQVKPVAGALLYTKYNFLVRFIMKRIAKKAGGDTDTRRDYEYTDWAELDRFVNEFAEEIAPIRMRRVG
jgi:menaquinone-dependent protoporphyrinogen oxidase